MTVADYTLAVIGLALSLAWCLGSFLVASIDAYTPAPDEHTAKTARAGCAALLGGIFGIAWFIGVLWNGQWGWAA
jgi:hypothetical protein